MPVLQKPLGKDCTGKSPSEENQDVYKRQVQDAIKKDYAESTIKEAAVEVAEDGVKTYKVDVYKRQAL